MADLIRISKLWSGEISDEIAMCNTDDPHTIHASYFIRFQCFMTNCLMPYIPRVVYYHENGWTLLYIWYLGVTGILGNGDGYGNGDGDKNDDDAKVKFSRHYT